jgi:murein DD-endopeptidase MepM/ murein hydrolase activator NlpD
MRRSCLIALCLALLLAAPVAHAATLGSRQLRLGSHGSDVTQLQKALRALRYNISVDGDFGPITDRKVRDYERKHHLTVDGIVGSSEAKMILASAAAARSAGGPPPPTNPPPSGSHVFPVRGSFSFGGAGARFGAPRGNHTHQGQDILAAEGTPVDSVSDGYVYWRAYQSGGAGNYVVIAGSDGYDYVYMHFRDAAIVHTGDRVTAGELIGYVGHTGDAEGPHLHFEVWAGGHWQAGGHPIDPLPLLQSWL